MREKHAPYRTHGEHSRRCFFNGHFTSSAGTSLVRAGLTRMSAAQLVRLISPDVV